MHKKHWFNKKKNTLPTATNAITPKIDSDLDDDVIVLPLEEIDSEDIFSRENLQLLLQNIRDHGSSILHMTMKQGDDLDVVLIDLQQQITATDGKKDEYIAFDNGITIAIDKPVNPHSDDVTLSHNKITLFYGNVSAVWYVDVANCEIEEDYANSIVTNINNEPDKSGIYFEKSEKNMIGGNNTGYKFWRADGKQLTTSQVFKFITSMKKQGDQDFEFDFPNVLADDETAPIFTYVDLKGKKHNVPYDHRIKPNLDDKHNLQSAHLSGATELEYAYDGGMVIGPGAADSSFSNYITKLQEAYNYVFVTNGTKGSKAIPVTGKFDGPTKQAFVDFQKQFSPDDTSGNVGKNTLTVLDSLVKVHEDMDVARQKHADELKAEDDSKKLHQSRLEPYAKLKGTEKTGTAFEHNTGLTKKEKLDAQLLGFFTLRAEKTPADKDGKNGGFELCTLNGEIQEVWIVDKALANGYTWFKVEFKYPSEYDAMTASRKKAIESSSVADAKTLYKNKMGWIAYNGDNVYIISPYDKFLGMIRAFDAIYSDIPLEQRITILREMSHDKKLDFDQVIGTPHGNTFKDTRPKIDTDYQLMVDIAGTRLPNGEVIDIYHLLVGLDVLVPGRQKAVTSYTADTDWGKAKTFDVSENIAAATWAGDLGSVAAGAAFGGLGKYDTDWANRWATWQEKNDFYYSRLAPDFEMMANIDAWGMSAMQREDKDITTIEGLLYKYYGGDTKEEISPTFNDNRKKSLTLFLQHYGFKSSKDLLSQKDAVNEISTGIFKFSIAWLFKNQGGDTPYDWAEFSPGEAQVNAPIIGPVKVEDWAQKSLKEHSAYDAQKFVNWLQSLCTKYAVSF